MMNLGSEIGSTDGLRIRLGTQSLCHAEKLAQVLDS